MKALPILVAALLLQAAPPPPSPADFGQWERLVTPADHGGLSPDGRWLAYGINRTNGENELRVTSIADGGTKTIAFGAQQVFSSDSKWLAASVGVSEAEQEKLRKARKPLHRKLALVNLSTAELMTIDGIESFAFSADGHQLLMRRYPPERPGRGEGEPSGTGGGTSAGAGGADPEETPGVTAIVRDLTSGRDTTFGNVVDAAWQTKGRLLAVAIGAEDRTGNGVQVFDPASGTLRVLDSGAARYLGLSWRKDADDLAVLKSIADDHHEGLTYSVLAWTGVGGAGERKRQYDPTTDRSLGANRRLVAFRRPSWSEDATVLYVGVAEWAPKPPGSDKAQTGAKAGSDADKASGSSPVADEKPTVDVWHPLDVDVMPKQKVGASRDRQRNLLGAWMLEKPSLTVLGHDFFEQVVPLKTGHLAYAVSWTDAALERSWGRFGTATISLVDVGTGERTKVADHVDDRHVSGSPDGKYILYFVDGQVFTIDTAHKTVRNISKAAPTSFVDRESDSTDVQKPFYGQGGWTKDDRDVLLYDKYDVWQVAADGSKAARLTDGAAEHIEYRVARLDPDTPVLDGSQPIYLDMNGLWSKKSGIARVAPGSGSPERLIWLDKGIARLAKAKDAPVFTYVSQTFQESPNAYVGGPDLKNMKQVTTTNAFQAKYAWGRAELVEYSSEKGTKLQGVLRYPAGYEAGKKYPMIVYVYEKLSDGLHRYVAPSEREYYNVTSFTSAGYFEFEPDIVFRPREPGLSVVECVRPAVAAVVAKGVVDAKRIGMIGHSWGGFDTAFMSTHTDVFAAAVAGAPITDLVSNYGSHHFSSGIAETDHIETGQQRMQVPVYEDLAAYTRNSAVFAVNTMTTPLLIEVGDADGTVFWHQGVELYNEGRRAKKNVVLLVYGGEDHGLRQKANQVDYHRRIMEWFGHYLKGEPAAPWITNGVSFLDKDKPTLR
jgi:dipeptidyl aminopeptidase/acylaminoacyl peptidase